MTPLRTTSRVAVAARGLPADALGQLFRVDALRDWVLLPVDSCEHAHFLARMGACDAVVVDDSVLGAGPDCLGWLSQRPEVPIVLLADGDTDAVLRALTGGARLWVPRSVVLSNPALLAAALQHAVLGGDRSPADRPEQGPGSQVARLVELLWEVTPFEGRPLWFSQRAMLERLHEEVCRSERHGSPLAVVLGEWEDACPGPVGGWAAECVVRAKRRCDVAGQYGPRGFMVLLPHTLAAGAAVFCRRLRGVLEAARPPGLRFGIAAYPAQAPGLAGLLRHAEEQLDGARCETAGA